MTSGEGYVWLCVLLFWGYVKKKGKCQSELYVMSIKH